MTNIKENNTVKVILESGLVKVNLELTGVKGAKVVARQAMEAFLDTLEEEDVESVEKIDVMEEMRKAYLEQAQIGQLETETVSVIVDNTNKENIETDIKEKPKTLVTFSKKEEDDWVKPVENQLDKYNREFPKLQDALSRNLYNKLTELQINQYSYFVTDKGVLKLQARYLCSCGNFKKHWVAYPNANKAVRCSECSKINTLVNVKGNFPSTDEYGNIYVTTNMGKKKSSK